MDDTETITIPTWGYRSDGEAKIFDLAPGDSLPDDWETSPTCITDPALATAEAVTARAAGRVFVPPAVNAVDAVPAAATPDTAMAEIARLKDIITAGMAENERLAGEIVAAEDELEAMVAEITTLRDMLAKAQAEGGSITTERDAALVSIETLAAELAQVRADLDAATAPKTSKAAK